MKAEVIIEEKKSELKFPLLARSETGLVVMFSDAHTGMVLEGGDSMWSKGHYGSGWSHVTCTEAWTILPPGSKVILTQE